MGYVLGTLHGAGGVWLFCLGILGRFILSDMIIRPIFKTEGHVMELLVKRTDPIVLQMYRHALAHAKGIHPNRSPRTCKEDKCEIIP
jgi:hypothetical protein